MIKQTGLAELESLSNDMFSPLSDREASLVVGGDIIYLGETGYDCILVVGGRAYDDFLSVDSAYLVY